MNRNPNCDGGHCRKETGEVRVLTTGGDGNIILCRDCFYYEIGYRRERNKELSKDAQFDIPKWEDLKVYGDAELPVSHAQVCQFEFAQETKDNKCHLSFKNIEHGGLINMQIRRNDVKKLRDNLNSVLERQ